MANETSSFVELAAVVRAHGLHGELLLKVFNERSHVLLERRELLLRPPGGQPEPILVSHARRHPKGALIRFEGVLSRDGAEALRGSVIGLPREALPPLPDDELYYVDLIGLDVRTVDGATVGRVEDIIDYPSAVCLKVVGPDAVWEIPALERYVGVLDPAAGHVEVRELAELEVFRTAREEP